MCKKKSKNIKSKNTFVSHKGGIYFAMKPNEMGTQYFFQYVQSPETLELKREKKATNKESPPHLSVDFLSTQNW